MLRDNLIRLVLGLVAISPAAPTSAADKRPNVLLIVADDLGYADVGFHGGKVPTPNIDSIAKNGARFTSGYVSGPYCSPTRAALLTGRYQQRFGHEYNPSSPENGLALTETTLADRLTAAGYKTGLVGKWHLGAKPELFPLKRGFEEFYGFLPGQHTYFNAEKPAIWRGNERITESEYLTDAFAREAISFVDRHQADPFFLYLAFNAVHTPLEADSPRLAKFAHLGDKQAQTYAAMLTALDEAIGRVLQNVRDKGLEENTLVFFLSDNGGPTMPGTTINGSSNAPLRGGKRTTLEGGVRVPFAVQWKGKVAPEIVYPSPVIQLDILPTVLAAAGIPLPKDIQLDGVDLLPYLDGKAQGVPHETLYWRLGPQTAVRHGDWKLVQYDLNVENYPTTGVSPKKLYNLGQDIGESKDLAAEFPEKVAELDNLFQRWNKEMAAPRWPSPRAAAVTNRE